MKVELHGGFGEKGRTCIGIEQGARRMLLDVGVNTSVARGPSYYPDIAVDLLKETEAIVVTHAHEDHVAALGWCMSNGFTGQVLMTAQTATEIDAMLADYATPAERALARKANIEIVQPRDTTAIGPFLLTTGRSGHIVGGVWCHVSAAGRSIGYCGDVMPASTVFVMDPLPACDLILIDASYRNDAVTAAQRRRDVNRWLAAHSNCAVLPTPLSGRSLELLALIDAPLAIHPSMREPLARQIAARDWLAPGAAEPLSAKLEAALDWEEHGPLPAAALLCHDGMGLAGPSRAALERARRERHPVLLTGHVPKGSPASRMRAAGKADWLRLPTHPNLTENIALVGASGASHVLAHSCDGDTLATLAHAIPSLVAHLRTGDAIAV